ncbi:peptidoglycan recognition protein [Streptomyces sp. NPDC057877]|uniref:peptidoglycan recognition protein family protein n=1 Tax=Streptomyces sp. NPDC057877 TaxID=3346269 RepID=UPI0036ACC431
MRGYLASPIGVTCAAVIALPLTLPEATAAARPAASAPSATTPSPAGSTQSLPLAALGGDRALGSTAEQGLPRRDVRHFSLVGVVWDDPDTELHGSVQVRTRAAATGTWSDWQDLQTHNADHAADPDTAERTSGRVRGATAPLWVGESDGVEVRVRAEPRQTRTGTPAAAAALPTGLRLELVDPGRADDPETPPSTQTDAQPAAADDPRTDTAALNPEATTLNPDTIAASTPNSDLAPLGAAEIPELDKAQTEQELLTLRGTELTEEQRVKPYIGPRPRIVTRRGWGADESLREKNFLYTKYVKAAFVHHTATGNNYTCAQVPSLIRGIYRYHVTSMGWRDVGYNFLVDKCGNIYEGRAGGVARPVMGAHTLGFNHDSTGIAVVGSYDSKKPSESAVRAVAQLTAWKLGLFGGNPNGKTYLRSGGGNLYGKGKNVRLNVISGHRDGFATECPGGKLYGKLGSARSEAARYQGR